MYLAFVLVAALLAPASLGATEGNNACGVSGRDPDQAAALQENAQQPAAGQVPAKEAEAPPPDNKPGETQSPKKADEGVAQNASGTPPSTGARKRRARGKKSGVPTVDGEPRKVVIHRGGTSEQVAQILPGVSPEEERRQRESAEQLLSAAESSVKDLGTRFLKPHQQEMVVQILQYMGGARSALKESDTQRAHTLALKAYLLADDLVKH